MLLGAIKAWPTIRHIGVLFYVLLLDEKCAINIYEEIPTSKIFSLD